MTTPALLPLSGRRIPPLNLGPPPFPHHRATLRLSEKFILLLILSAFITLCFGAFFFLPDSSKHKRFDLGLEDVLIPHIDASKGGKNPGAFWIHGPDEHRHRLVCLGAPGSDKCHFCQGIKLASNLALLSPHKMSFFSQSTSLRVFICQPGCMERCCAKMSCCNPAPLLVLLLNLGAAFVLSRPDPLSNQAGWDESGKLDSARLCLHVLGLCCSLSLCCRLH